MRAVPEPLNQRVMIGTDFAHVRGRTARQASIAQIIRVLVQFEKPQLYSLPKSCTACAEAPSQHGLPTCRLRSSRSWRDQSVYQWNSRRSKWSRRVRGASPTHAGFRVVEHVLGELRAAAVRC